jgi:hypothetical protein
MVRISQRKLVMKLVVCGLNGDHLFSGSSMLATDGPSEPPASGVFPVALAAGAAGDDADAEAETRRSGIFPRAVDLGAEAADEEYTLNLVDGEWSRLCTMPVLRRIGERPRLRIAG